MEKAQNSQFFLKANTVCPKGEEKEEKGKELELISLNNKSSELARGEKSYERIICKEFFTLPQVSFVKNVFKLSRDFFNLKYFLPFSPPSKA